MPMMGKISSSALLVLLGSITLLAIEHWETRMPRNGFLGHVRRAAIEARGRNATDAIKTDNGYYESLMANAAGDDKADERPITSLVAGSIPRRELRERRYQESDFVIYEGRPRLNFYRAPEGPIITNSFGFFDYEHSIAKPPRTRRIVILGDSIARGWGVTFDQRFDHLLEQQLRKTGTDYEVLNFAVTAYRITQMLDVALAKAPLFAPDVYVVTLSELSAGNTWGRHIIKLVEANRDLKYDLIREVVSKSGVRRDDSMALAEWKLAPYRYEVIDGVLGLIKQNAKRTCAQVLVMLLPAAEETDVTQKRFSELPGHLDATDIPTIDVLDAFNGTNVEDIRISWYDPHPNARGHRLIADRLYHKLQENGQAWADLTGSARLNCQNN